ncbi:uncharacterized protein [Eleutherodactylus coqui]|uniref:uncharacterized protein n=1 Tax=Eleutherodactylus coqui TaxID=57060 RepID=UPI00346300E6
MPSSEDYYSLVKGVRSLDFSGTSVPCQLLLTGDTAFPVLVSPEKHVLIAASKYGKGRVVITSHESYLDDPSFMDFLKNAISWLKPSSKHVIGVDNSLTNLEKTLSGSGYKVEKTSGPKNDLGVLCIPGYDDSQAGEIVSFLREGGGLLIGAQAWHWSNSHTQDNVLLHFPGNKITSVAGVYFTARYGEKGIFDVSDHMPKTPWCHDVDFSTELKLLLQGITNLDISGEGIPSELLLHGPLTFPVGMTDNSQCFVGAAFYGQGRIVVEAHESLVSKPELKTFTINTISWLDMSRKGKIGVNKELQNLTQILQNGGLDWVVSDLVPGLSVYCCTSYSDGEAEKIQQFVAEGGGLLIAGQSWHWSYSNPDAVSQYPGNKILNKLGITILPRTIKQKVYKALDPQEAANTYHFLRALCQLLRDLKSGTEPKPPLSSWMSQLRNDVASFLKLPASPFVSSIQQELLHLVQGCNLPNIIQKHPVENNSKEALIIYLAYELGCLNYQDDPSAAVEIDATYLGCEKYSMPYSEDYYFLVKGVRSLDFSGTSVPCQLLLTGDTAFPVLVSPEKHVLIAASKYGKGRVVITSHESYLDDPLFMDFLKNAISWLKPSSKHVIGVDKSLTNLEKTLSGSGYKVEKTSGPKNDLGVLCIPGYDDSQAGEIVSFLREGGGLLIGAQAWHWSNSHAQDNVLLHFPGNKITSVAGVYFTARYGEKGIFNVSDHMPKTPWCHDVDFSTELRLLLQGITNLDISGESIPSELLLHGPLTFPVGMTDNSQCFVGAAFYGQGRIVVEAHESLVSKPELKTFTINTISWLDMSRKGKIGVNKELQNLTQILQNGGLDCVLSDLVPGLSVYCCTSYSDGEAEKIQQFVAEGGGLLIAGQSWHWSYSNPDAVSQYPGNKILNKLGITILPRTIKQKVYKALDPQEAANTYHFLRALCQLLRDLKSGTEPKPPLSSWMSQLRNDVASFLKLPASPFVSSIRQELLHLVQGCNLPNIIKKHPVENNSKEALIIYLAYELGCLNYQDDPSAAVEIDATYLGCEKYSMPSSEDYYSLVKGVRSLDFSGISVPCQLLLTGDTAFPVLVSPEKHVLIAASKYGKGRVVITSHESYLDDPSFMDFLKNAISWLNPSSKHVIGVDKSLTNLEKTLSGSGYKVEKTSGPRNDLGVLCIPGYDDSQAGEIVSFLGEGGGLLIGAQAWHWSNSHTQDNVLLHFPGNKITSVAGVYFTARYGEKGIFDVSDHMPKTPWCHE